MTKYQTNFTGEDFSGDDTGDDDVKVSIAEDSKKPKETPAAEATNAAGAGSAVPEGTTAEILQWVGDDKEKAQAALDKENAEERPRKGLTGELEELLTEPEAEDEGDDTETKDESAQ